MKSYTLVLSAFFTLFFLKTSAQNSTGMPPGNIGIGIVNPTTLFQVHNVSVPANTVGSTSTIAAFTGSTPNMSQFRFLFRRHKLEDGNGWENVGARLQFTTDVTDQGYLEFNPADGLHSIALGTAGNEWMRILHNGNIGIGTATPLHKLDVRGNIYTNNSLYIDGGDLILNRTTNPYGYVVRPDQDGFRNLCFATVGAQKLDLVWVKSNKSFFEGKVGIGTDQPGGDLQVSDGGGDSYKYGSLQIVRAPAPSDNYFHISFIRASNNVAGMGYVNNSSTLGLWQANTTSGTPLMSFLTDQTVGIKTTDTKGYALAVNGNAIFTRVKVQQLPWSDYVFNDDYNLKPLAELEQFIKANKHLPEVPSAKEVEANGIEVGENQALLLKKIEELTLYIIEQNKKMETIQGEIDKLKSGHK